jgi:putative protease
VLIVAGIDNVEEIVPLLEAGASEFYAGFVPTSWSEKLGYSLSPNRREAKRPNITDLDSLCRLTGAVHQAGKKIYITVNAHAFPAVVLDDVRNVIDLCLSAGADGLIVADPGLLLKIQQWGIAAEIILSGDFGVFNSRSLDWIRDRRLATRVILPRYLTLDDVRRIVKDQPTFEYEAFVMNERCFFSSTHCYSIHGHTETNFCSDTLDAVWTIEADADFTFADYEAAIATMNATKLRERVNYSCERSGKHGIHAVPCGLCALEEIERTGVRYLKIVTRGLEPDNKLRVVRLVHTILETRPDRSAIIDLYTSTFPHHFREMCERQYNCYFSKV